MADLLRYTIENDEDAMRDRYLTFLIEDIIYGIAIGNVIEIVGIQPITKMPETPDYIKGIINLRGSIIPIIDVRLRFKKPEKRYDDRTCIVIIEFESITVGLIVDSVSEVLTISQKDIADKPASNIKGREGFIKSIGQHGEKVILLIDCEKLLSGEEFNVISG